MKFCPSCGTSWNEGDLFCSSCGYKIEVENIPASPQEEPVNAHSQLHICPACNSNSDPDNRFCENCGFDFQSVQHTVSETVKPAEVIHEESVNIPPANVCPGCNSVVTEENRFCENCGYDLQPPAEPEPAVVVEVKQPEVVEEVPVVPVAEEQIQVPVCPDCGKPIVEGNRFCDSCGHDFNPVSEPVKIPEPMPVAAPVTQPQPVAPQPTPVYRQNEQAGPNVHQPFPKKKKGWLWIIIGILAFAGLAAGGWFGYEKLIKEKTPEVTAVDTLDVINDVIQDTAVADLNTTDTINADIQEDIVDQNNKKELVNPADNKTKKTDKKQEKAKTDQKTAKKEVKPVEPEKKEADKNSGVKVVVDNNKPVVTNAKVLLKYGDSDKAKSSGPKNPVSLTIKKRTVITRITTDHYNDGKGATPGNIIIKDKSGNVVGTFHAAGRNAIDGTANAKWVAEPKITLEPGGYYISVSDMKSWSKTFFGYGFVIIEGSEQ